MDRWSCINKSYQNIRFQQALISDMSQKLTNKKKIIYYFLTLFLSCPFSRFLVVFYLKTVGEINKTLDKSWNKSRQICRENSRKSVLTKEVFFDTYWINSPPSDSLNQYSDNLTTRLPEIMEEI